MEIKYDDDDGVYGPKQNETFVRRKRQMAYADAKPEVSEWDFGMDSPYQNAVRAFPMKIFLNLTLK